MSDEIKGPWKWTLEDGKWGPRTMRNAEDTAIMCDAEYYPWTPDSNAEWNLIAAAPDLLAALVRSRGQWIHSVNAKHCLDAIAKTEGKADSSSQAKSNNPKEKANE